LVHACSIWMSVAPYSLVEGDNSIIREYENVVMAN
jgi:hypothetical protein